MASSRRPRTGGQTELRHHQLLALPLRNGVAVTKNRASYAKTGLQIRGSKDPPEVMLHHLTQKHGRPQQHPSALTEEEPLRAFSSTRQQPDQAVAVTQQDPPRDSRARLGYTRDARARPGY